METPVFNIIPLILTFFEDQCQISSFSVNKRSKPLSLVISLIICSHWNGLINGSIRGKESLDLSDKSNDQHFYFFLFR